MNIQEILDIKTIVNPHSYLKYLQKLLSRIEQGNTGPISLTECSKWGFNDEDSMKYMLLLVQSGILIQKIKVFDIKEEIYRNPIDENEIYEKSKDPKFIKFWFKPAITKNEAHDFFLTAP